MRKKIRIIFPWAQFHPLALIATALFTALSADRADATLIIYSDRVTFNLANPGLPIEDFEKANISPGTSTEFDGPLDSSTNNAFFQPGDILPGIMFDTPEVEDRDLRIAGPMFRDLLSKSLFSNFIFNRPTDRFNTLNLSFLPGVTAIGFDYFNEVGDGPIDISIFGANGLLGTEQVFAKGDGSRTPQFFGVSSDELILSVNLSSVVQEKEGIDNVVFGSSVIVSEPSTTILFSFGLLCFLILRWKEKVFNQI